MYGYINIWFTDILISFLLIKCLHNTFDKVYPNSHDITLMFKNRLQDVTFLGMAYFCK